MSQWKRKASEGLVELFERGTRGDRQEQEAELRKLHEKIGWLVGGAGFLGITYVFTQKPLDARRSFG